MSLIFFFNRNKTSQKSGRPSLQTSFVDGPLLAQLQSCVARSVSTSFCSCFAKIASLLAVKSRVTILSACDQGRLYSIGGPGQSNALRPAGRHILMVN